MSGIDRRIYYLNISFQKQYFNIPPFHSSPAMAGRGRNSSFKKPLCFSRLWRDRNSETLNYEDRNKFCKILGKVNERYKIIIYSFLLMTNHYHLLMETIWGNLSRAIQRLSCDYALYFSRRHKRPGHLFQGLMWTFLAFFYPRLIAKLSKNP